MEAAPGPVSPMEIGQEDNQTVPVREIIIECVPQTSVPITYKE